eukprot:scaffold762_cov363-Pavlova_lutheri.AAC.46
MQVLSIRSRSTLAARGQLAPMPFVWNSIGRKVMSVQSVHSNFQGNLFKAQAIHWKRHWDLKKLRMHKDWPRKRAGFKPYMHSSSQVPKTMHVKEYEYASKALSPTYHKVGPLGSSTAVENFMLSLPRQFFQGRATYKAKVPRTYVG